MALHKDFPKNPYAILDPSIRWFPADEDLREKGYDKLLPPLVADLRKQVKIWRDGNYEGASETSKALLNWWFEEEHIIYDKQGVSSQFQYYFAQREAIETVIWLYEVVKVKDKSMQTDIFLYPYIKDDKRRQIKQFINSGYWYCQYKQNSIIY